MALWPCPGADLTRVFNDRMKTTTKTVTATTTTTCSLPLSLSLSLVLVTLKFSRQTAGVHVCVPVCVCVADQDMPLVSTVQLSAWPKTSCSHLSGRSSSRLLPISVSLSSGR